MLLSCSQEQSKVEINDKLENPFFSSDIAEAYLRSKNSKGIINYSIKSDNEYDFKRINDWNTFVAINQKDTLSLYFNLIDNSKIKFQIVNEKFQANISYTTDIVGSYTTGNKYGTFDEPELNYKVLIVNKKQFMLKDTLKGYFRIITDQFGFKSFKISKEYEGSFIVIINDPDSVRKYNIDRDF
jgi:hypothetical protein